MKKYGGRFWLALAAFAAGIVALDQWTKALVIQHIPYGGKVPVVDGLFHLTYVRNSGAAFSMLTGMRWLFLVLLLVFFALIGFLVYKGFFTGRAELWCLAAIGGGALGNAVDRAVSGAVVDMIEVEFMRFAVFNVADSFITCGAIALVVCILFFRKKEAKHDTQE